MTAVGAPADDSFTPTCGHHWGKADRLGQIRTGDRVTIAAGVALEADTNVGTDRM
jgi:hypothetical protein